MILKKEFNNDQVKTLQNPIKLLHPTIFVYIGICLKLRSVNQLCGQLVRGSDSKISSALYEWNFS